MEPFEKKIQEYTESVQKKCVRESAVLETIRGSEDAFIRAGGPSAHLCGIPLSADPVYLEAVVDPAGAGAGIPSAPAQ